LNTNSCCIVSGYRGRGRGRHPAGLKGREIGMWYAAQHGKKKAEAELKSVG